MEIYSNGYGEYPLIKDTVLAVMRNVVLEFPGNELLEFPQNEHAL